MNREVEGTGESEKNGLNFDSLTEQPSFDKHMEEIEKHRHQASRHSSFSENREIALDRGQNIVEARSLAKKTEKISDLSFEEQKKFYLDLRKQLKEAGKTENEINDFLEEFGYSQQTDGKVRKSEEFIPPEFPSDFNPYGAKIVENSVSDKAETADREDRAKMLEDGDF